MYTYSNAYGFKPLMRPSQLMPSGGRSLTIPNQSINISDAITRYSAPSIAEKLKGYYEEEGLELPNFDRLDKVERLQLLADAKANLFTLKEKAEATVEANRLREEAESKSKAESNPIPNSSNTSNDGKDGK